MHEESNQLDETKAKEYQQILGSLTYFSRLRPDIAYATSTLSQKLKNPTIINLHQLHQIIGYLKFAPNLSIRIQPIKTNNIINGYSDAGFAGDTATRKSQLGFIIYFLNVPIIFKSKLTSIVCQSTTEAELLACNEASNQITFL